MQDFTDLYIELGEKALTIDGINWVDLWNNQVNFLEDEFPFTAPAVFFQFTLLSARDIGKNAQEVEWQIDMWLFYETMADTSHGSMNMDTAVGFLKLLNELFKKFHGTSGVNYSSMRRIGLRLQESGGTGNLYMQTFTCISIDESAVKEYDEADMPEVVIVNEEGPETEPDEPMFMIRG